MHRNGVARGPTASDRAVIFVSHATVDCPLVDRLVGFLQLAGVPAERIFYSSQRPTGIPTGTAFDDYILDQLADAALVIQVFTKTYLCRPYCLMELGAQRLLRTRSFPIRVPPVAATDIARILAGVQVAELTEASFDELRGVLIGQFDFDLPAARWQLAYQFVFEHLPAILAQLPPPPMVERDQYDGVLSELERVKAENATLRAAIQGQVHP